MVSLKNSKSIDLLLFLSKEVKGFIKAKTGNWDLAEDLFQDLTLKLIKSDTFLEAENPRAFLYSAANNLIKDHYRKTLTREKYIKTVKHETSDSVDMVDSERIISAKMQIEAILKALEELPTLTQKIFRMVRFQGLNQREAAEELELTTRTVERHLAKALAYCHKKIRN